MPALFAQFGVTNGILFNVEFIRILTVIFPPPHQMAGGLASGSNDGAVRAVGSHHRAGTALCHLPYYPITRFRKTPDFAIWCQGSNSDDWECRRRQRRSENKEWGYIYICYISYVAKKRSLFQTPLISNSINVCKRQHSDVTVARLAYNFDYLRPLNQETTWFILDRSTKVHFDSWSM